MSYLHAAPLDADALARGVTGPADGASVTFVGRVRNHHGGRGVLRLEYSAYAPMADACCAAIVAEAETRWPVRIGLAHRLGALAIGDAAVVVVAAGGHRGEAFEACRWVIEAVKERVPIWKREYYDDGSEAWVDPTAPGGIAS